MKWKVVWQGHEGGSVVHGEDTQDAPRAEDAVVIWRVREIARRRLQREKTPAARVYPRRIVDLVWLDEPETAPAKTEITRVPAHDCLAVPCPACGAGVGHACVSIQGIHGPWYAHTDRDVLARIHHALKAHTQAKEQK